MSTTLSSQPSTISWSARRWVERHPVAAYLLLAFTFAWGIVGFAILTELGIGLLPIRLPFEVFATLASVFGLAFPAFIVAASAGGRTGVSELLSRSLRWRVGLRWYLVALFGLLVVTLLVALTLLGAAPLVALGQNWTVMVTVFLPGVLVPFVLVNLSEELGWMGFMQHTLQRRRGPLLASVMVAPVFALVHLPAFFVDGWIGDEAIPFSQFPEVLLQVGFLAVFAIFFRVLAGWIYNGLGSSVLITALFHSTFNMVNGQKITPRLFGLPESVAPVIPLLAVMVFAVLAVVLTRRRLGLPTKAAAPRTAAVVSTSPLT